MEVWAVENATVLRVFISEMLELCCIPSQLTTHQLMQKITGAADTY